MAPIFKRIKERKQKGREQPDKIKREDKIYMAENKR
jgi:hypothetical protein